MPLAHYGQSHFADLDSDGRVEHLLPGCRDPECRQSVLFVHKDGQWNELPVDFGPYGFVPPGANAEFWNAGAPMNVKVGHFFLLRPQFIYLP